MLTLRSSCLQCSVRTACRPPTIELKAQQIAASARTESEMHFADTMSSLRGHTVEKYDARRFVSPHETTLRAAFLLLEARVSTLTPRIVMIQFDGGVSSFTRLALLRCSAQNYIPSALRSE